MGRTNTVGIVVYRENHGKISYLLLHHGGSYWNFPKGRMEKGETEQETALRELSEETGISTIDVNDSFRAEYDYDFDSQIKDGINEHVHKHAIFFLGKVESDKVEISDEHIDHGWFDYETARKRLFFQNGQDVLKQAHQYLSKNHKIVL